METSEEGKIPLVAFTGGFDSAYMLEKYLEYTDVEVVYIGAVLGDKMQMELLGRKKIIEVLNSKSQFKIRRQHVVNTGYICNGDIPDKKWVQPMAWMTGLLQIVDGSRHSEVALGYLNDDGIFVEKTSLFDAWNGLMKLTKWNQVKLALPLEYKNKWVVLKELSTELLQHAWCCERPHVLERDEDSRVITKAKPCCKCMSCLDMYAALQLVSQAWGASHVLLNAYRHDLSEEVSECTHPHLLERSPLYKPSEAGNVSKILESFSSCEMDLLINHLLIQDKLSVCRLTSMYDRANRIITKNPPISTENVFRAMQEAYEAGQRSVGIASS